MPTNSTPKELKTKLYNLFPKLVDGGGFEYLKASNSRKLSVIPLPQGGYSAREIKAYNRYGRIYIRPIQKDLEFDQTGDTTSRVDVLLQKCNQCLKFIEQSKLRDHIETCSVPRNESPIQEPITSEDYVLYDPQLDSAFSTSEPIGMPCSHTESINLPDMLGSSRPAATTTLLPPNNDYAVESNDLTPTAEERHQTYTSTYSQYCSLLNNSTVVLSDSDDENISIAVSRSLIPEESERTASQLFMALNPIAMDNHPCSLFNICRTRIWDGAVRGLKRKTFKPENRISVMFTDTVGQTEGAVDLGGPRGEFFTLVLNYIRTSNIFEGPLNRRVLAFNSAALANDAYFHSGQLMAMSIVHGGPAPTFFANTLYESLAYGFENATPGLEDVGDADIRAKLENILSAKSVSEIQAVVDELEDFLNLAGVNTIVSAVQDKVTIVSRSVKFYVLDRTRSAYERFASGLETLGVLRTIREHPVTCRQTFLEQENPLTAQLIQRLFKVSYSEPGSNMRVKEETTISFWFDYLQDAEEREVQCPLSDILAFSCGSSSIPVVFNEEAKIEFLMGDNRFPTANTCSVVLRLPTMYTDYASFKNAMDFGILNSQSFGLA